MSEPIENVVDVVVNIGGGGLSSADLSVPCFFFGNAKDESEKGMFFFTSSDDAKDHFSDKDDLYLAMQSWESLSSKPMLVYGYAAPDPNPAQNTQDSAPLLENKSEVKPLNSDSKTATNLAKISNNLQGIKIQAEPTNFIEALAAAASKAWFYRPYITELDDELDADTVQGASDWCEANNRRFDYTTSAANAKDPGQVDDLISLITSIANRRSSSSYSENKHLCVRFGAVMSMTNFSAENGYRDSEFKKVGLSAEDMTPPEIVTVKTKGGYLNISAASVASETVGRLRYTMTASPYREKVSEVEAIDSLILGLQADLATFIESQDNLPQTYDGQQSTINRGDRFMDRYVDNGFLGTRNVIHPVTKEPVLVNGYLSITEATDIDKLTDSERRDFQAAPLIYYIYPAGSINAVKVTVNVLY